MRPVRLEPTAPHSHVKHSTTEPPGRVNACPTGSLFIIFEYTVDPDQLVSDKAI